VTRPAQDLQAEQSVLGALLVSEPAAGRVLNDVALNPDDFYLDRHRLIFQAIADLYRAGTSIDVLTVTDALTEAGNLDQAGGKDAVFTLAAEVAAPGNAGQHAQILKKHAAARRLTDAASSAITHLAEGQSPGEVAAQLEGAATAAASTAAGTGLRTRPADLAKVKPIRWAWQQRLPIGYLSLLLGAEGIGKGTLTAWLIAQLTRGTLPGNLEGEPCRVLIVGDEDAFNSVVVPRLYAAQADLANVAVLDESSSILDLTRDSENLARLIQREGYRLVYFDALLDALGADLDDWRAKAVRDAIRPLRRLADELDVAALGSLHPNKGSRQSFRDLVSGSHAFNASSRASLYLTGHPEDDQRRILVRGKGNLSAEPGGFEFEIQGRDLEINGHGFSLPVVANPKEGTLTLADVITPGRPAPVRDNLADEIDALGTGQTQSRAEIAQLLGRKSDDRSVGRALDQLEDQGRWIKEGRGKWRRIGIGTSKEVPMSKPGDNHNGTSTPPQPEPLAVTP